MLALYVFALLGVLLVPTTSAFAAGCTLTGTLSTWALGANGNWSTPATNWSPSGAPNSSSNNVCITDGTSTVTLDTSPSIASLQLASGNTLNVGNNDFSVYGPQIINAGQINLNAGSGDSVLILYGNTTLSGTGVLTLSANTAGNAIIEQGTSGLTLTNQSTIQGEGIIGNNGLALINSGTINANSTGGSLATTLDSTLAAS
jgi:hypothetical protein